VQGLVGNEVITLARTGASLLLSQNPCNTRGTLATKLHNPLDVISGLIMTTSKVQTKRKLPLKANNTRKRTKLLSSAQELPWKAVSRAYDTVYDGDDGILELDEVDGVEVVYEDTEHGKRAVFRVSHRVC
jgi:hypothetical protein